VGILDGSLGCASLKWMGPLVNLNPSSSAKMAGAVTSESSRSPRSSKTAGEARGFARRSIEPEQSLGPQCERDCAWMGNDGHYVSIDVSRIVWMFTSYRRTMPLRLNAMVRDLPHW